MNLSKALSIRPGDVVALIGAGGKTTAAMRLANEIAAAGGRVVRVASLCLCDSYFSI